MFGLLLAFTIIMQMNLDLITCVIAIILQYYNRRENQREPNECKLEPREPASW